MIVAAAKLLCIPAELQVWRTPLLLCLALKGHENCRPGRPYCLLPRSYCRRCPTQLCSCCLAASGSGCTRLLLSPTHGTSCSAKAGGGHVGHRAGRWCGHGFGRLVHVGAHYKAAAAVSAASHTLNCRTHVVLSRSGKIIPPFGQALALQPSQQPSFHKAHLLSDGAPDLGGRAVLYEVPGELSGAHRLQRR